MKISKIFLLFIFTLSIVFLNCKENPKQSNIEFKDEQSNIENINSKAIEALEFCKSNNFNTDFCILIDMSIHSGKNRMFIYDFKKNEIERSALCAHGSGKDNNKSTTEKPLFGNEEGSLLTSLGKFKIGARAYSQFGINIHYKLHGLEETNNNAFQRIVVLHSYTPISPTEIYPFHLPLGYSHGCPVTDDDTMKFLDKKLKNINKPVLLWIYYDNI